MLIKTTVKDYFTQAESLSQTGEQNVVYMCNGIKSKEMCDVDEPWGLRSQLLPAVCDPMDCRGPAPLGPQAALSMGFSRQKYWSGLPVSTPGDLSNSGIEPTSLGSPALAGEFLTTEPPGKPLSWVLKAEV